MRISSVKTTFYSLVTITSFMYIWYSLDDNAMTEKSTSYVRLASHWNETIGSQIEFNPKLDTLAFIHIQKTGGSNFDRNIIKNLLVKEDEKSGWQKACHFRASYLKQQKTIRPGKSKLSKFKKFTCLRGSSGSIGDENNDESSSQNWYFSRQVFGWICGLHADYSELKQCVPKFYKDLDANRIYFYTILRDPVKRYLSEWKHVARGATWKRAKPVHCTK